MKTYKLYHTFQYVECKNKKFFSRDRNYDNKVETLDHKNDQ